MAIENVGLHFGLTWVGSSSTPPATCQACFGQGVLWYFQGGTTGRQPDYWYPLVPVTCPNCKGTGRDETR